MIAPTDEIEITPEMVEAGVAVLVNFEGEVSRAFLAKEVFRAMAVAHTKPNRRNESNMMFIMTPALGDDVWGSDDGGKTWRIVPNQWAMLGVRT